MQWFLSITVIQIKLKHKSRFLHLSLLHKINENAKYEKNLNKALLNLAQMYMFRFLVYVLHYTLSLRVLYIFRLISFTAIKENIKSRITFKYDSFFFSRGFSKRSVPCWHSVTCTCEHCWLHICVSSVWWIVEWVTWRES